MAEVLVQPESALRVQHGHPGTGARATGRPIDNARPGRGPVPVELPGRNGDDIAAVIVRIVGRSRQLGDGDAKEARLLGVTHGQLFGGRGLDHLAHADDVAAFVGRQSKAKRLGVGNDVEHAAVRDIHAERAQLRYLDRRVQVDRECRNVPEGHAAHLSAHAIRADADEAGGRLQRQLGDRFGHGYHARLEERRNDADRVGARHAGVFDLLHDHVARVGIGACRREDEVAIGGRVAARLAQHPQAQVVGVFP